MNRAVLDTDILSAIIRQDSTVLSHAQGPTRQAGILGPPEEKMLVTAGVQVIIGVRPNERREVDVH